jgi:hypothetical protein
MTRGEITPRVDDGNYGFTLKVLQGVAHLFGAGTMSKRAHIVHAKPAMATKLFRSFLHGL